MNTKQSQYFELTRYFQPTRTDDPRHAGDRYCGDYRILEHLLVRTFYYTNRLMSILTKGQWNMPWRLVVLDLHHSLSQEVVVQHVRRQMRFNRKTFQQELLAKVFPRLLTN